MPNREKVIKNLREMSDVCAIYGDIQSMRTIDDAIALLREQEPRVMTYEEIKDNFGVPVWVEYAGDENCNGYGVPTSDLEAYIMIFGANAYCAHNACSHNVKWRCWTSRPSEQQMRETPWEGEEP